MYKYVITTMIALVGLFFLLNSTAESFEDDSPKTVNLLISNASNLYDADGNDEVITKLENYIEDQLNNLYEVKLSFEDEGEIVKQVAENKNTIGYLNGLSCIAAQRALNEKVKPVLMAESLYDADQAGEFEKEKVFESRLMLATSTENKEKYGTYSTEKLMETIYKKSLSIGLVEGKYKAAPIWLSYLAGESDIKLNQLHLKYYPSEQKLREGLESSDVDFIITDAIDALDYGEELLNSKNSLKLPPEVIIVNKNLSKEKREILVKCLMVIESDAKSLEALEKIYHNVGFGEMKPFDSIQGYKTISNTVDSYLEEMGSE